MTFKKKLFILILFSIAFAFVEASIVFYLREMFNYLEGYDLASYKVLLDFKAISFVSLSKPLFTNPFIYSVEILREISTIIMLVCVSLLAANKFRQQIGAFLISFALWDIFYYIFLKYLTGWPKGLFDKDVFFLIPTPLIGPVITPLFLFSLGLILGVKLFLTDEK